MHIKNHKLEADVSDEVEVFYKEATSYTKTQIEQKYIVLHFTAGVGFDRSVHTLSTSPKVSSHLVVSRSKKKIAQLVPFDQKAWHAGASSWVGLKGLNAYSIGIELDNSGKLTRVSESTWKTYFNRLVTDESQIYTHTNGTHWHTFPKLQLEVLVDLLVCLCKEYKIPAERIITHEMISPGRKVDTGPAFPLKEIKKLVAGLLA